MSVTGAIVEASKTVFLAYGASGLFALALIESVFFPVPPDVVLIPLALADPSNAVFLAFMATAGSVVGAVMGYVLGWKGGRPVLDRYVSERNIDRVDDLFDEYGVLAVGVAGFTPIPYKVFTLSAGAFRVDWKGFFVVSVLSRGARFFVEALLIMWYGEQIVSFITGPFGILSAALGIVLVASYIIWKQYL